MISSWQIWVSAGADYESFSQCLGGDDIKLSTSDDPETGVVFYAYSRHLDCCGNVDVLKARVFGLQVFLNGAKRLAEKDSETLPISFYAIHDGRQRVDIDSSGFDDFPFCSTPHIELNEEIKAFQNPKRHYVSHLIQLSKTCKYLRSLLIYSGLIDSRETKSRIMSWNMLYKMHDTIKTACKEYNYKRDDFITNTDLNRFKASCNNFGVIGIYARHGITAGRKPKGTISDFSEASKLIYTYSYNFLQHHIIHNG